MSNPAENFLARLEGVKRTDDCRWMAPCPAHKDKRPSLSIRELGDGRVLIHCFAGCSVDEVTRAAGIEIAELFPPRLADGENRRPRERRPYFVRDAILALKRELTVAWVILADVASGKTLSDLDRQRAGIARDRCVALMAELSD